MVEKTNKLIEAVLRVEPEYVFPYSEKKYVQCPMCSEIYIYETETDLMNKIHHDEDCPYTIATELNEAN